jgi:hypothetical protein
MKANEDSEGRSLMRRSADDIADEIIIALVESRDEGGHGPVLPLTMMVSVGSEYDTHRLVVLVEHLGRFNDDMGTNGIVRQPVSMGTRHS